MIVISPAAAGLFTDRMGSRRTPFLLCLVSLAGATALLAVGTNVGLWVAGRLLQGVSAGMLWVVCLALLTDTVGPAGIGQAVGVIGIPMSIGPIVGPLLGGVNLRPWWILRRLRTNVRHVGRGRRAAAHLY